MDTKRKEVEAFLREKIKGNWLFLTVVDLNNAIGGYPKDELNEMLKEQLIRRRDGVNGFLIEVTVKGVAYLRDISVTEKEPLVKII